MTLRRESRMLRLRLSGRGLADLDFWTKSDPFLTLSRPNRKGTGMVQVQERAAVVYVQYLDLERGVQVQCVMYKSLRKRCT